jgi:hypothetical protein
MVAVEEEEGMSSHMMLSERLSLLLELTELLFPTA